MDRVSLRSWAISTAVHAGLALAAALAVGVDSLAELVARPAPPSAPPAAPPPPAPQAGDLVLAPETAAAPRPAAVPLPALGPADLPALPVITAQAMRSPDLADSRGRSGSGVAALDLPNATLPADTLSEELRGRTRSRAYDLATRLRATAANQLEILLAAHARALARPHALRITQRRLLLGVVVDRRGVAREIAILTGTGVPELDRALRQALTGLSLPPIEPDVTHYFQIDLP